MAPRIGTPPSRLDLAPPVGVDSACSQHQHHWPVSVGFVAESASRQYMSVPRGVGTQGRWRKVRHIFESVAQVVHLCVFGGTDCFYLDDLGMFVPFMAERVRAPTHWAPTVWELASQLLSHQASGPEF